MPVVPSRCDPPSLGASACRLLATTGAVLALLATAVAARDATGDLLRQRGLRKTVTGDVWLLPDERQLQEFLREFEPAHRSILGLQKKLSQTALQNRLAWEANRQQIDTLRQQLAHTESDDPKRQQIERQIRRLELQSVEPSELAGVPQVRAMLIELINLRLRMRLWLSTVRQLHQQIMSDYQRLAADSAVAGALEALGENHRLGPLHRGYRTQLQRLERYDQLLDTDSVPLYRQSDQMRFGGIIAERIPATFTWQDSAEPTLIPATLLEAAGVAVPVDAETVELPLERHPGVKARPVVLPSVRFGGVLLHDVPALALPPEAEDIGARIGAHAFYGYTVELQPERLRLVITP